MLLKMIIIIAHKFSIIWQGLNWPRPNALVPSYLNLAQFSFLCVVCQKSKTRLQSRSKVPWSALRTLRQKLQKQLIVLKKNFFFSICFLHTMSNIEKDNTPKIEICRNNFKKHNKNVKPKLVISTFANTVGNTFKLRSITKAVLIATTRNEHPTASLDLWINIPPHRIKSELLKYFWQSNYFFYNAVLQRTFNRHRNVSLFLFIITHKNTEHLKKI